MRPKIKIQLTLFDKYLELSGIALLLITWYVVVSAYGTLPDTIPIHYNGAGQADAFGDKRNIFALPAIGLILNFLLTILNRFPHIFNYPVEITEENALRQYTIATRMIRFLKLGINVAFGAIVLNTIKNPSGDDDGVGIWMLPMIMAVIFIPLVYFLISAFQNKSFPGK